MSHTVTGSFFLTWQPWPSFSSWTWNPSAATARWGACSVSVMPMRPSPVLRVKRTKESSGNIGCAVVSFQRPGDLMWILFDRQNCLCSPGTAKRIKQTWSKDSEGVIGCEKSQVIQVRVLRMPARDQHVWRHRAGKLTDRRTSSAAS